MKKGSVYLLITSNQNAMKNHDEKREEDVQTVCSAIINAGVRDTGDSGTGGECPFCYKQCRWDANDLSEIQHNPDCVFLVAKDLSSKP